MSSPPRSPHRAPRQWSPSRRQSLLARRLSLARRPPPDETLGGAPASRKRPFPTMAQSAPSPTKTETDGVGDTSAVKAVGEYEAWEEVSHIWPLLSYGEESAALLSSLLDLPAGGDGKAESGGSRCNMCKGETVDPVRRKRVLSNLSLSMERMLQARTVLRRANSMKGSPAPKRNRPPQEKQQSKPAMESSLEMLPWNVILRTTIRLASHAAKWLHPSPADRCKCNDAVSGVPCDSGNPIGSGNEHEAAREHSSAMHSMLQALDVVSADLHVLSRMQQSQPFPDRVQSASSTPIGKGGSEALSRSREQRKSQLPRDRMLGDWKSNNKCHLANDFGREVWGPSRYAFLNDVETIATKLVPEATGITADEWREKVNSVVVALDECVRVDLGHTPPREREQQPTPGGPSPSLMRSGASPSKPASLASITRAHIERVGSRMKAERQSPKKESPFRAIKAFSDSSAGGVNLQSVMDKESNTQHLCDEGDTTDELGDAYRLIMAFGSSGKGGSRVARDTIERRLALLVKLVATAEDERNGDGLNADGAESYLESLLRTLAQPSDPNVWLRSMNDSDGEETAIMLRRGRALLVSFLVGIKAPGGRGLCNKLEPSPVPSYLGYLSPREDLQASRAKGKEEDVMKRTSYFLPAVDMGESDIPPAPIVTEVGLSLCVKNYFYGDSSGVSATSGSGVSLFKGFGPLQYPASSTNKRGEMLGSVAAPLPDIVELTRDLFDLTLRLAADDDSDHEDKPISLRLVAPSASESLSIVLRVIADHSEWLSPHSIVSRYRFILQHTIQAFLGSGAIALERTNNSSDFGDDGFAPWSRRASHLIDTAKTSNRGRMVLYATQFMMLLCASRKSQDVHKASQQSAFYACLQLHQPNRFWNEVDKAASGLSCNIVAAVLDLEFCAGCLLPLSLHSALLLQQHENAPASSEDYQSVLSLITILCSVLDVLANNGFLNDCIHAGWAIQMLLFSVGQGAGNEMWKDVAGQLERFNREIWGNERQTLSNQGSPESAANCIKHAFVANDAGATAVMLLPTFEVFARSLVQFASSLHLSMEADDVKRFCRFIGNAMFDRYATVLRSSSSPGSGHELFLLSSWVEVLVSTLQEMASSQRARHSAMNGKSRGEKTEEEVTEEIILDMMTPMLRCLHLQIMQRALRQLPRRGQHDMNDCSDGRASPEFVASIFVDLRKREEEKFLTKPSPAKTRRWGVYRKCIEKVFALTPSATLLACSGQPALTLQSAKALEDIWDQYGQSDFSHSASIMVAAALHVNRSAAYLTSDVLATGEESSSSIELKRMYDAFSSQAKSCIVNTFACFNANDTAQAQAADGFDKLTLFVQRELTNHGEAEVGLAWWNEVTADLQSTLLNSVKASDKNSTKTAAGSDIARAFSTLDGKLSAISAVVHQG